MRALRAVESLGFRAVRKLVLRPIENWRSRLEIIEQLESLKRLGKGVVVNGPLMIGNPPLTELGDDVCINAGLVVRGNGSLVLGSHVHFGQHVEILTSNHNFDRPTALPYDKVRVARDVDVGDCVWFGDHVIVTPGVRIGEGAILGAGAVVTREVPPLAVVGGAPAKVLRYRDEEPYRRLRGEGKYLGWPRDHDVINGRELQLRRR